MSIKINLTIVNKFIFNFRRLRQKSIKDFHLFDVLTLEMIAMSKNLFYLFILKNLLKIYDLQQITFPYLFSL